MACRVCKVVKWCQPEEGTRPHAQCFYCRSRGQSMVTVVDDVAGVAERILPRQCTGHRRCWFYGRSDDLRNKCQMHATMSMLEDVWRARMVERDARFRISCIDNRRVQLLNEQKRNDEEKDEVTTVASDPEFGVFGMDR